MSRVPEARVVRGGVGDGEGEARREARAGERPLVPILRLAPREVPSGLRAQLLFGGKLGAFGWAFAAFGMVFVAVFAPMADLPASFDREGTAEVTRVEATSASENEARIYRVHYRFEDERGRPRVGASFTTAPRAPGSRAVVEYDAADPSRSRLEGMRQREFGPFVLFVLVFPLVGIGIGMHRLIRGRRELHLLRHGIEVRGTLIRSEPTNVTINDRTVMALTFEYEAGGAKRTATVRTHEPAVLQDEASEAMLYDPHEPGHATTLDHLPGAPKIGPGGELSYRGLGIAYLIAPFVAAALLPVAVLLRWYV